MVQTVGFGLAGRLAHILAVAEQAVEMELVGVFTVSGQTGITGEEGKGKEVNALSAKGREKKTQIRDWPTFLGTAENQV